MRSVYASIISEVREETMGKLETKHSANELPDSYLTPIIKAREKERMINQN